jgi:hypothetical protein
MPFVDIEGKTAGVAPMQYGPGCVNTGVEIAVTSTFIFALIAHCPAVGVK